MTRKELAGTVILGLCYVVVTATALVWVHLYTTVELKRQLQWLSPLVLEINFCLIIVALIVNGGALRTFLGRVSRRAWIVLLVTVVIGTAVTTFGAPRIHRIFYDEDIYLNIGQNIACERQAGMCNNGETRYGVYSCYQLQHSKEPNAWPYLISLLYRAIGVSHLGVHIMNNVIWALSVMLVFFLALLLFGDERAGLFAALLFAVMPEGMRWANTTAIEPSALFFGGLTLAAALFFVKHPDRKSLFLAAVILPFAIQFRPESVLIAIPAGLTVLLMAPRELTRRRFYAFLLVCIVFALPHLVHLYCVKAQSWGAPGDTSKFALSHLYKNIAVNGPFYVVNKRFPLIVTLLALVGLAGPLARLRRGLAAVRGDAGTGHSFHGRETLIVTVWFLLFWGIFLFFYAGSYDYGADVRFSLLSQMPLALLGGLGGACVVQWIGRRLSLRTVESILAVVIVMSFLSFLPYVRAATQEAWSSRFDHRFAHKIAESIPPDSFIFTHNPNMFLIWGKNAGQASIAMSPDVHLRHFFKRYPGGVYFHYNYWCTVSSETQPALCRNILKKFDTEKIMWERERDKEFALYRLALKQ